MFQAESPNADGASPKRGIRSTALGPSGPRTSFDPQASVVPRNRELGSKKAPSCLRAHAAVDVRKGVDKTSGRRSGISCAAYAITGTPLRVPPDNFSRRSTSTRADVASGVIVQSSTEAGTGRDRRGRPRRRGATREVIGLGTPVRRSQEQPVNEESAGHRCDWPRRGSQRRRRLTVPICGRRRSDARRSLIDGIGAPSIP